MNLFNAFKKKNTIEENTAVTEGIAPENFPELHSVKLLFIDQPKLNADQILEEVKKQIGNVDHAFSVNNLIFSFPDHPVKLADATIPAQCNVMIPDKAEQSIGLPDTAFTQNWHWQEANQVAGNCKYEIMVTDLMSRTLAYKERLNLFMDFLVAVIRVTQPSAVYAFHSDKIMDPATIINIWDNEKVQALYALCNVRLFKVGNDPHQPELLMDTLGLHAIGLPDFQIRFTALNENELANLLWSYAYHIYEYGDIIENGETIEGLTPGTKWKCTKQPSLVSPDRMVIDICTA